MFETYSKSGQRQHTAHGGRDLFSMVSCGIDLLINRSQPGPWTSIENKCDLNPLVLKNHRLDIHSKLGG